MKIEREKKKQIDHRLATASTNNASLEEKEAFKGIMIPPTQIVKKANLEGKE